jgi:mannose-6-phosphate isomerase-like protein (cupin superfamily)
LTDQQPHVEGSRPVSVTRDQRTEPPEQQTAAIRRQQAFAGDDHWVGYIHTKPGVWSGWHHHAETETFFYVLKGRLEFELADGEGMSIGPEDFCHMPGRVVHRERTAEGDGAEAVLVRIGSGPTVVNVDGPSAG